MTRRKKRVLEKIYRKIAFFKLLYNFKRHMTTISWHFTSSSCRILYNTYCKVVWFYFLAPPVETILNKRLERRSSRINFLFNIFGASVDVGRSNIRFRPGIPQPTVLHRTYKLEVSTFAYLTARIGCSQAVTRWLKGCLRFFGSFGNLTCSGNRIGS